MYAAGSGFGAFFALGASSTGAAGAADVEAAAGSYAGKLSPASNAVTPSAQAA